MSPRRPPEEGPRVQITSSTHALAVALYAAMVGLGLLHLQGAISSQAVLDNLPGLWAGVWATGHLLAPVLALAGAVVAARRPLPVFPMAAEMTGCAVFAITEGTYVICLLITYGFTGAPSTIAMGTGISIACAARATQIAWDLRRIIRAAQVQGEAITASLEIIKPKEG